MSSSAASVLVVGSLAFLMPALPLPPFAQPVCGPLARATIREALRRTLTPQLCNANLFTMDAALSAELESAQPSPALQPREVMQTVLTALHRSNFDEPWPRFGCEVAMRFLAPSNPASQTTAERFASYLEQPWYEPLIDWHEYRWEGDLSLLGEGEAYQQLSVRSGPSAPWTSVRWILRRVPYGGAPEQYQWMIESVFVAQPEERSERSGGGAASGASPGESESTVPSFAPRGDESPGEVVLKVMRAVRQRDEPYRFHGCEVAMRYCSPTNKASRLSPQAFAQYLDEPWYRVLTEWDSIELDDEPEVSDDGTSVRQEVLVRREGDETWTIVAWELSNHFGRWLTDSLSITE